METVSSVLRLLDKVHKTFFYYYCETNICIVFVLFFLFDVNLLPPLEIFKVWLGFFLFSCVL